MTHEELLVEINALARQLHYSHVLAQISCRSELYLAAASLQYVLNKDLPPAPTAEQRASRG